ncbi:MAG: hypothetical protein IMZ60_03990 [Actinobacteria bacterium]|nr:hypothetical protein [Actinomycetota bacterium]
MKLFEYESKKILSNYDIPVPKGYILSNISKLKKNLNPLVVKAQVLTGGRYKKGLVKFCKNSLQAKELIKNLLNQTFEREKIKTILVEEMIKIKNSYYLSFYIDKDLGKILIVFSEEGGVDIENIGKEKFSIEYLDPFVGLNGFIFRNITSRLKLTLDISLKLNKVFLNLYKVFRNLDAVLVEVNPLVISTDNNIVALDAKIIVDNNAVFRHPELKNHYEDLTNFEKEVLNLGASAVELDGNIGIIVSGAGLQMATVDMIKSFGGEIGIAIDLKGAAFDKGPERMAKILSLLGQKNLKVLLFSAYFQIARCDTLAKSIINSISGFADNIPIIIRLKGNKESLAKEILGNDKFFVTDSLVEAIERTILYSKNKKIIERV